MYKNKEGVSEERPCILVVDDDEDLMLIMKLKLKAEGFEVMLSYNGDGLFQQLEHSHPDLILLDITMNGVDGGTICKQLKANASTSSIPILMFSANRNIEQITLDCGADGYLSKPFDMTELKEKINGTLHK